MRSFINTLTVGLVSVAALLLASPVVPQVQAACTNYNRPDAFIYTSTTDYYGKPYPNGGRLVQVDAFDMDKVNYGRIKVWVNGRLWEYVAANSFYNKVLPAGSGRRTFFVEDIDSCNGEKGWREILTIVQ